MRRVRTGLLTAIAVLAAYAGLARAHSFEPAVLDLRERGSGVFDVVWRPPGKESGALMPGDPALAPRLPADCGARGDLGSSDEMLAFRVECGEGRLRGGTIGVDGLAGSRVDVIVRITWNDGRAESGVLRSDSDTWTVPVELSAGLSALGAPARTVAERYLLLGVGHILRGTDHVLFVLGLVLLAGTTRALVATISAFTVAHSLTLAAAVLGTVAVPPAPVEAAIALSIVLLARELVRAPGDTPTLTRRRPWVAAFAFGLLHGLGFAGALAATGVPADQVPLALLAFNGGVEIGQLMIVATCVAAAAVLQRQAARVPALRFAPAYAIGALAVMWTIERVVRFWPSPT